MKYTSKEIDLTKADEIVESTLGKSAALQETVDLSTDRKFSCQRCW